MKKLILPIFCFVAIFMMGCENSTNLRCATIREITSAGSENYGVSVSFMEDERVKEKFVDVQVKANEECQLVFWEENGEKMTLNLYKKDDWYSLTSLIAIAQDKPNTEKFMPFKDAVTKTYIFNSEKPVELTLRVVAGDVEENSQKTGDVLVGSEDISDEFKLKIQKVINKEE